MEFDPEVDLCILLQNLRCTEASERRKVFSLFVCTVGSASALMASDNNTFDLENAENPLAVSH